MERRDSDLPEEELQEQSEGQTPVPWEDSILGFCSLVSSVESEGSQMSLEESPETQWEIQKPQPEAGMAQQNQQGKPSRERDSSMDSNSSKVAPDNWRTESTTGDGDEAYFCRAAISAQFEDLKNNFQPPQIPTNPQRNQESVVGNKYSEPQDESFMESQDATQRAYWDELQNTLPLPMTNLLEQEALEILTKSLRSYNKGIGKDHKLTQQLQRQVDQLSKNLKSRKAT